MGWFRPILSIFMLVMYVAVLLATIVGIAIPLCSFGGGKELYLWKNCTADPNNCVNHEYQCSQSRDRFATARAFSILSCLGAAFCVLCAVVALIQLLCYEDKHAGAKGLRGCIYGGVGVLIFSIVAFALAIVIQVEPLCDGDKKLEDVTGWEIGTGAIAFAVATAFALVAACLGRMMENRISTSKLGV